MKGVRPSAATYGTYLYGHSVLDRRHLHGTFFKCFFREATLATVTVLMQLFIVSFMNVWFKMP
jgi:hypothetical protein